MNLLDPNSVINKSKAILKVYNKHKEWVEENKKNLEYMGTHQRGSERVNGKGEILECKRQSQYIRLKDREFDYIFDVTFSNLKNNEFSYQDNSIAHYLQYESGDSLEKYWSPKNDLNPWYTEKSCNSKYFILCQEKSYHNYNAYGEIEGYSINGHSFYGGTRCGYCHTKKTHILDSLYFNDEKNIKDLLYIDKNTKASDELLMSIRPNIKGKFYTLCKGCENISINNKSLYQLTTLGISCKFCGDGVSIGQKLMANLLQQLNQDYEVEFNDDWTYIKHDNPKINGCKYYDFYIKSLNMIIEIHGIQHYEKSFKGMGKNARTLDEEQVNDRLKKELALNNEIKKYIVIDCRYSKLEWIKENILKELSSHFDFSNINWELAWEQSQKSLVFEAVKLWNENLTWSTSDIADYMKLAISTIIDYLNKGNTLNLCNYTKEEIERRKSLKISKTYYERNKEKREQVYKLWNDGKCYGEIREITNLDRGTIAKYLNEGAALGLVNNYNKKESKSRGNKWAKHRNVHN